MVTILYSSCQHSEKKQQIISNTYDKQDYNNIIAWDTISHKDRLLAIKKYLVAFEKNLNFAKQPQYWLYKSFQDWFLGNRDSAQRHLLNIDTTLENENLYALRQYLKLNLQIGAEEISSGNLMEQIIVERQKVEKSKSVFLYLMDDLLANAFYNNDEYIKSLKYTKLYRKNHPLSNQNRLKQRYFDISFLLSQGLSDTIGMKKYLDSSRMLAVGLQDTLAFMRTIDYEAQLDLATGRPEHAVKKFRVFYNYLKSKDKLRFYVFHNLAEGFLKLNLPDSTIKYIKMSEEKKGWDEVNISSELSILNLLSEAYLMKGDYKGAYLAKARQHNESIKITTEMQKEKIEELITKYETRKKDQDIKILKETNILSSKLLSQQRWIFFISFLFLALVLLFTYKIYKEQLLKAKHNQLINENKQYVLEQKNRQNQLNPHFIYNAIANLQGLIGAVKTKEANRYLMALTRLIRDILELNRHDFITLEQEVRSLKNYILLQKMRFNDIFDYRIDTDDLEVDNLLIPPMLVQPFVENAIEHGLKNLACRGGMLKIDFYVEDDYLIVCITDNGIGVKEKHTAKNEKTSLSQVITEERLTLLYTDVQNKASLNTYPNYSPSGDGYQVKMSLPLKYMH